MPAAALDHVRDGGVGAVEDGVEVRGDDLAPLLDAEAADRAVAVDAGVVDEDVEAAERLHGLFDEHRALVGMSHAGLDEEDFLALVLHGLDQGLGFVLALVVVDDDLCAVVGELERDGLAEASRASGDDRHLVLQNAQLIVLPGLCHALRHEATRAHVLYHAG